MTLEARILDAVAAGREELVELTARLVGFDTTARTPSDPPRQEADLQAYLGQRLGAAGAAVDIWEPSPADIAGSRQMPPGLGFDGRPQLAARFAGSGGGRSLLLNGHIDVVPSEPRDRWTSDPNQAEVRDGNLYGRGSCDMKGGVACMMLRRRGARTASGVRLRGDLIVNTITDEESSGAGGLAAVRHGVRADAGIVPEPTAFEVWVACRGLAHPHVHGHRPPGPRRDGAAALARRRRRERDREDGDRHGRGAPAARGVARQPPLSATGTCRPATSSPSRSAAASGRSPTRPRAA